MRGVSECQCIVVDARSLVLAVPLFPGEADRRADKCSRKAKCNHGCNLNVDDGPHRLTKSLLWEDLQEEEQEGELDETEGVEIRDLAYPEQLHVTLVNDCKQGIRGLPEEYV